MKWLANATREDAMILMLTYPDFKIGKPVPKELEGLVGIYGNYPDVGKDKDEDNT